MKGFSSAAWAAWLQPSRPRQATRLARWAVLACLALASLAGARGLDPSFASNGIDTTSQTGADVHAIAHLPRPDGGSVVVFAYQTVNGCPAEKWCLVVDRFLDNGLFIGQTYASVAVNFTRVSAAAIDSQGRIVVVGSVKIGSGPDHDFRIVRLTPLGVLDEAFINPRDVAFDVAGSDWRDEALAVAIDATDRIVVAGHAATSNIGDFEFAIARLTPAGNLDPLFNGGGQRRFAYEVNAGRSFAIATAVAIDSNGRIVIGGNVYDLSVGRTRIGMARLLPSGDYDTTWCQNACTANLYPAIHSGRSVTYFGNAGDARTHTVAALAVNGINQVALVGNHTINNVQQGYAMTLSASGSWSAEKSLNGAVPFPEGSSAAMGGVAFVSPSAPASDLIVTGVAGYSAGDTSWFFAQRFTNALAPRGAWGPAGEANSLVWFDSLGIYVPDAYGDVPHATAIDSAGRVLMSGAAPGESGKLIGVAARIQGDAMFGNGFE